MWSAFLPTCTSKEVSSLRMFLTLHKRLMKSLNNQGLFWWRNEICKLPWTASERMKTSLNKLAWPCYRRWFESRPEEDIQIKGLNGNSISRIYFLCNWISMILRDMSWYSLGSVCYNREYLPKNYFIYLYL